MPRLNRRRYAEVVRLLKEVIQNVNTTIDRRLRAADTLIGIYDRLDKSAARRDAARSSPVVPVGTEVRQQQVSDAERMAREFLLSQGAAGSEPNDEERAA
jgi:hypothetical protein